MNDATTAPRRLPSGNAPPAREALLAALGAVAFAALAAVRLLTLARDPWEWDEVLFTGAARDGVDVRVNHPHPPGYPLYALLARLLALAGAEPFHAALWVAAAAGLLAAVLLFRLAEELGASREAALVGALLWALTPSVWLHSVRPLSDAPAAAALFLAAERLLRTAREPSHGRLLGAAVASALCFAVRPQVGLALLPAALWAAFRVLRARGGAGRVALAALAGLAAAGVPYAVVVASSGGFGEYLAALRAQTEFVRTFDSPTARELLTPALWERWAVDPFGLPVVAGALWAAAAAGALLAPRAAARAAALFVPLALLTVPALAAHTAPRYALGLAAFPALLASFAADAAARRARFATAAAAAVLLGGLALPSVPALVEVSSRPSPSSAALEALRTDPLLRGRPLLLDPALRAHADAAGVTPLAELAPDAPLEVPRDALVATVDGAPFGLATLRVFRYADPLLAAISRARFREVRVHDGGNLGALEWSVSGPESWADGDGGVHLAPGGSLLVVTRAAAVRLRARTWAGSGGARLETCGIEGLDGVLVPQGASAVDWRARSAFRIRVAEGTLSLSDVRLAGFDPGDAASGVEDAALPAAVDEPEEGSLVAGPLVARGWGLRTGGGHAGPVEFWVDGRVVVPERIERSPRPDVAAALPELGDASAAGWRAVFAPDAVGPGPHVLTVVISGGGAWRAYPPRRFTLGPSPGTAPER